ncbi:MAG: ABC transporter substrate-binding protein [Fervidicoccaceae archaeon]
MKGITLGIVLLVVGLVAGLGVGYAAFSHQTASPTSTTTSNTTIEIPIGVEVSLSGSLQGYGPLYRTAAQLAESDVNSYLSQIGSKYRVKLYFEDDKSTPDGALAAAQTLAARGIKILFTYTSSATSAVMQFSRQNDMIVISYASTAPQLAIPDNVFRLETPDTGQARAIASLMWLQGIRNVAIIYRGDDWGDGLFNATRQNFVALGGTIIGSIRYDPNAKDYSAEVQNLANLISSSQNRTSTAVLALSFPGDFIAIFNAAKNYPVLMSVRWYGSDGTVNDVQVRDVIGQDIVNSGVGYINVAYTVPYNELQDSFIARYENLTGNRPSGATFALYDGIWAIALTVVQTGTTSGSVLTKAFPLFAQHYFGLSGWLKFDQNGDRQYGAYSYVELQKDNSGKVIWNVVGTFDPITGTVTLNS